ncbi:MAG: DNA-binding protein, partial [Chitinophagaceae bacterium]|nr:DNA-binding protein [Chitinophagaceae bacterium]
MDLLNIDNRLAAIEKAIAANKKALTFEEGCRYTGFAPSYMYKLTSGGIIPFSKPFGKTIFFDRDK